MATVKNNLYGTNINLDSLDFGSSGVNWNDLYTTVGVTTGTGSYTFNDTTTSATPWITTTDGTSTLSVSGDADVGGDIRVQGRSLAEFMDAVEQQLNILRPDPQMEQEWHQLAEIRQQYEDKLRECREKSLAWKKLQQSG